MNLSKQRLEAFSDAVIAIIITIMVLSIPLPSGLDYNGLLELGMSVLIYLISFLVVGSYWSQHHRALSFIENISGRIILMNMLFLFFLSMIPFFTKWVIENPGEIIPAIGYNIDCLIVNAIYMLIYKYIIIHSEHEHMQRIRKHFYERRNNKRPTGLVITRFICTAAALLCVTLFSFFFPILSTYVLLGMPVILSIVNLYFDERHEKKSGKTRGPNSELCEKIEQIAE